MNVIYIDCSAGLSGSALLGAMVDLGANPELLVKRINNVAAIPFQLTFYKRQMNGTTATSTLLKLDTGQATVPAAAMVNNLTTEIIAGDELRKRLCSLFDKLIVAQARIYGLPLSEVTMSEVEILKMLIIATGFFTALELLEIERVNSSAVPVSLHTDAHNSAPLLMELARGMSVKQYEGQGALLTPLGVALLACRTDEYGPLPEILLNGTGYGSSSEDCFSNVLVRIMYGTKRETPPGQSETITIVETAIDDMNPEFFPFLIDHLLTSGAVDAFIVPIYMKKGRTAHQLTVLCEQSRLEDILTIIFKEATTLGVRIREEKRRILPRYSFKVNTPYGEVTVKAGCLIESGPPVNYAPEFEDCKRLALLLNIPVKEVYAAAQRAAHEYINKCRPLSK